jgi:hypothetical protein
MTRVALLVLLLFSFACARTAPTPVPTTTPAPAAAPVSAAALEDHYGDSPETSVPVPVAGDEVKFENEWMFDRFGRFRRRKFGVAHQGDRHYDVITIELPDHSEHTVYFDITDLWATWGKEEKKQ